MTKITFKFETLSYPIQALELKVIVFIKVLGSGSLIVSCERFPGMAHSFFGILENMLEFQLG